MQYHSNNEIERLYLDYVNNWLSATNWASHHGLNKHQSNYILRKGKSLWRKSSQKSTTR
jgi:hypothetical protein